MVRTLPQGTPGFLLDILSGTDGYSDETKVCSPQRYHLIHMDERADKKKMKLILRVISRYVRNLKVVVHFSTNLF